MTQKFKNKSPSSLKKKSFACMISDKNFYVACEIICSGKLIWLCFCLHKHNHMGLINQPALDHFFKNKLVWSAITKTN